jgi:hypothetical protein
MIKVYKNNIIEGLNYLSSYELQKIAWFENDQGLSSSYVEDVESVFDDTGLDDALNEGHVVFDKKTDSALRELDESTNSIDEFTQTDEEIFNSPEMAIVRKKAAKALELVLASDGAESTVEIIE